MTVTDNCHLYSQIEWTMFLQIFHMFRTEEAHLKANYDYYLFCTFSQCRKSFTTSNDFTELWQIFKYRHRSCNKRKTLTESQPWIAVTNYYIIAELPEIFLHSGLFGPFHFYTSGASSWWDFQYWDGKKPSRERRWNSALKQQRVFKNCSERGFQLLYLSGLTSSDYKVELLTLTKDKEKFKIVLRNRLDGIITRQKVIKSNGCAIVEKRY